MTKYEIIPLLTAIVLIAETYQTPEQIAEAVKRMIASVQSEPRTEQKEKTAQSCNFEQSKQNPD